jgi:hypothetical protein
MGIFGTDYPPGCNSVPGDDPQSFDITAVLEGLGKRGHGLCGKDADLDNGGQIKVLNAWVNDDDHAGAVLSIYANICEPSQNDDESEEAYEERRDAADQLVASWDAYSGEWTGSDYWAFSLARPSFEIMCSYSWDNDKTDEENQEEAAGTLYKAIFTDGKINAFRQSMTELNKAMNTI